MAERPGTMSRRVYVLPDELAERVKQFQADNGHASEVDAVRSLLNVGLCNYETVDGLAYRFKAALSRCGSLRDAACEVLVGHPLVASIHFSSPDKIVFKTPSDQAVVIRSDGVSEIVTTERAA